MSFDILDGSIPLPKTLFLEASAGTGKTFAMEHYFVRLLLQGILIHEIVVLTFTKAARADLLERIHSCLSQALDDLEKKNSTRDYLKKAIKEDPSHARALLKRALNHFDQAQITTIHGFCKAFLTQNGFLDPSDQIELKKAEWRFIANEVIKRLPQCLSPSQILRLSKLYQDGKGLEEQLVNYLSKGSFFAPQPKQQECQERLKGALADLFSMEYPFSTLESDLESLPLTYRKKELGNLERETHYIKEKFASNTITLFDVERVIEEGFFEIVRKCTPNNEKQKPKRLSPYFEKFCKKLKEQVDPILSPLNQKEALFCSLMNFSQGILREYLKRNQKVRYDDLIDQTLEAIKDPNLSKKLKGKIKALVVDEFQDTDPKQIEIFSQLLEGETLFSAYVGDPKQSIYGFRQADLESYLTAKKSVPFHSLKTISHNFRSTKLLVDLFNRLFSVPDLFSSKMLSLEMSYEMNEAKNPLIDQEDTSASLIYGKNMGEFMQKTLSCVKKHLSKGVEAHSIAILVRTNTQGKAVEEFFLKEGISATFTSDKSPVDSLAYSCFLHLFQALMSPDRLEECIKALVGPLFFESIPSFIDLDMSAIEAILGRFYRYQARFFEKGFLSLYHLIFVEEGRGALILQYDRALFDEFETISNLLIAHEQENGSNPFELFWFFKNLGKSSFDQDIEEKRENDVVPKSVQILTIHKSKGLQFDIVFPLGMAHLSKVRKDLLLYDKKGAPPMYHPFDDTSALYERQKLENESEELRLLYVAITRAKKHLYLFYEEKDRALFGTYLRKIGGKEAFDRLLEGFPHQKIQEETESIPYVQEKPKTLIEPMPLPLYPSVSIASFSSLATKKSTAKEPLKKIVSEEKTIHTLPSSMKMGSMLHLILEKVQPQLFCSEASSERIDPYLLKEAKEYKECIEKMLKTLFEKPLFGEYTLSSEEVFLEREMEFLHFNRDPLLRGVIDALVFTPDSVYLIDWKSNNLGEDLSFYDQENMRQEMEIQDYFTQEKIYRAFLLEAMRVFPGCFEGRVFMGSYYIFLRGLDKEKERHGIFFIP